MLDEGVRVALPEARTVGYVEREAFAQGILLARMADQALEPAPIWCGPLEDFPRGEWRGAVDCLTAGFPCQPWSAAGKQQGESDDRWIWPAIADIVDAVRPSLVFLENVPGLVIGRGINRVFGDLARLGFDAEWCSLSAADVGATHLRKRVFILAVDACGGRRVLRESCESEQPCWRLADWSNAFMGDAVGVHSERRRDSGVVALADRGTEETRDQWERCGNSANPAVDYVADAEGNGRRKFLPEWGSQGRTLARGAGADLADSDGRQREQLRGTVTLEAGGLLGSDRCGLAVADGDSGGFGTTQEICGWESDTFGPGPFAPGPSDPRWPAILLGEPWLTPAVEPGFRGLVDGDAVVVDESRADQLRAIGNGVVALQAAVAFAVLTRRLLT